VRAILTALLLITGLAVLAVPPTYAGSSEPSAGSSAPATTIRVVRPVTAAGTPAPGWTIHRERGRAFCDGAAASAVSAGIVSCSPSAAYLPACWRSGHHTVRCLRDPLQHALVRMRYSGTLPPATKPATPMPLTMRLFDGHACQLRIGGAGAAPKAHPRWTGYYSCDDGGDVFGPRSDDGVIRTHPLWWVREVYDLKSVYHRAVRTAYLVGTAR
jgi:hypothetical protein